MKFLTRAMVAAGAVAMVAPSSANADAPDLGAAGNPTVLTAASTGQVTARFLHSRAEFTNYLMLFASAAGAPTGGGQQLIEVIGAYPNVGVGNPAISAPINVTAGQELLFGICTSGFVTIQGSVNSACTSIGANYRAWYMGAATNNPTDNDLHAVIMTGAQWNAAAIASLCHLEANPCLLADPNSTVVGFEDIANLGDADWNDLVFEFSNVSTVPEPGTMGLLALGLVGLSGAGVIRRRRNK
jgi:hypothetical protein